MAKKNFSQTPSNPSPLSGYFSNKIEEEEVEKKQTNSKQEVNKNKEIDTPSILSVANIKEKQDDKKGKLISARVNEQKWKEFKQVAKSLNYSANELLNILLEEVVSSHNKGV